MKVVPDIEYLRNILQKLFCLKSEATFQLFVEEMDRLCQACGYFFNTCISITVYCIIPFNDEKIQLQECVKLSCSFEIFHSPSNFLNLPHRNWQNILWLETKRQTKKENLRKKRRDNLKCGERGKPGDFETSESWAG